jgi:hypothetical protein
MLKLCAGKLIDDFNMVASAGQLLLDVESFGKLPPGKQPYLPNASWSELRRHAAGVAAQCGDLGLLVSHGAANDLIEWLDKILAIEDVPGVPTAIPPEMIMRVQGYIREIVTSLRREAKTRLFLVIAAEHQRFYEPPGFLFTPEVDVNFGSIRYDLTEAGKCLALERSTAAVYHLVRCLEAGLRALARCLGIPDPVKGYDQSWGRVLESIKAKIEERWPTAATRLSGEGQVFASLYGSLAAIKSPYRDTTMHLQEKYTEEEARYVFEMVKGLMTKIADRMDESGEPKLP